MSARRSHYGLAAALALTLTITAPAPATWSIVIADAATKEVAVGTVTCLNNYDLLALVPVVVVGKGAAACQASGDFDGVRRPIIFQGLMDGTPPVQIYHELSLIAGHTYRQYGIVDTVGKGHRLTWSGANTLAWKGGVAATVGTMVYAIQGNILVGDCVVAATEQAILNTPGDIPAKLMAGMEAAGRMGGDGRCSCSPSQPTSCGCPPASFSKPGHIGGVVVARIGDTDDPLCDLNGCVDGDYFMRLNVPFQSSDQPDPVVQLRDQFNAWRVAHAGRPDAIHSTVAFSPPIVPVNGSATTTMHVTLRDWRDLPVTVAIQSATVTHAADSAGLSTIGAVNNHGDGTISVTLTAGTTPGVDRFVITVDDGIRPVTLMPTPALTYDPMGDMNCDGLVNSQDIDGFIEALFDANGYVVNHSGYPNPYCPLLNADFSGDGYVSTLDVDGFVAALFGP